MDRLGLARDAGNGRLARLMKDDAIVGVTSNPTIFQKALATGEWYDEQLTEVLKTEDDPTEIFLQLAMEDIRRACDLMRPIWDGGRGEDGYVSLEVDPTLAYDREATFEQAIRLHGEVDRPNLFVKIPATVPGLAAIEGHREGQVDQRDADLLARALRGRRGGVHPRARAPGGRGGDPTKVASVASFFVSRVDTEADRRLDEIGGQATRLKGSSRSRTPSSPTGTTRSLRRAALGVPRRQGARRAALPLGVHVDEEPGVPGRDVRRGADRPEDREHDAGRDGRGLPGARNGRADDHRGRRGSGSCSNGSRRSASTTTTSSRRSRPKACSSPTRSRSCWTGSAQASPARGGVTQPRGQSPG